MATPKADGRRKPRPGLDAQRTRIRDAAVELFVSRGTRAVSVSAICGAADVSRPTFYRCYPDKDALLADLYATAIDSAVQGIGVAGVAAGRPPGPWLRPVVDQILDAIFERPRLALWLYVEAEDPGSPLRPLVEAAFDSTASTLSRGLGLPEGRATRWSLRAVMAACRYVTRTAIEAGLDEAARRDAKSAAWAVVQAHLPRPAAGPEERSATTSS